MELMPAADPVSLNIMHELCKRQGDIEDDQHHGTMDHHRDSHRPVEPSQHVEIKFSQEVHHGKI